MRALPLLLTACSSMPAGLEHFYVQSASGRWDVMADYQHPSEVSEALAGETWDEIIADGQAHFIERFGIDLTDPTVASKFQVTESYMPQGANYRIVHDGEHSVGKDGWVVEDLAWGAFVADPAGVPMGGDFPGRTLNAGQGLSVGRYVVHTPRETLIVPFYTATPLTYGAVGDVAGSCELHHPDYGLGTASVYAWMVPMDDGTVDMDVRVVARFEE